ncbi:MAG: ABC transporter ATP-binding protein [Nitrospirae bacterium]|nr:ABC transporter ATP-binding protein [Nitrospirota bacterium]
MTEPAAIRASALTKIFAGSPPTTAIDGLSLEIRRGEFYGIVGPDGAGKTTTLRILAGIMECTSGEAWVAGHSILTDREKIKDKISYMSQRFGLYEDLTVMENILFYADIYDVPKKELDKKVERLLGFSNLTHFKGRLAGKLSGGMKQKLGLACALIHSPEVLLLDEPTNGVDPVSRRDFWKILYELWKGGVTILFSTSYLDEAERCTRVALIHRGRVLAEGVPKEIRASLGVHIIELSTSNMQATAELLKSVTGAGGAVKFGDKFHVTIENPSVKDIISDILKENTIEVLSLRDIVPSLEDIFIELVKVRG